MGAVLGREPGWQDRLREEARAVDQVSAESMKALEQQDLVWKETLRLYPVAGHLARMALRETRLGAHRVPAAGFVHALAGSVQRDPDWWSAPERFDPERFDPERAEDKRHKAIYLPFGAGAHACIGAQIANVEVKGFWHALLRRCRLRAPDRRPIQHVYTPVGMPADDVELLVERL